MKVQQLSLTEDNWMESLPLINIDAKLFLLFVSPQFKLKQDILDVLCKNHPDATIIGCSTAGEISDVTVKDNTISLTAIHFQTTTLKEVSVKVDDMDGSFIPDVIMNSSNWSLENLKTYDSSLFAPALVQFIHRLLAYILILLTGYAFLKYRNEVYKLAKFWLSTSFALLIIQVILGILTLLNVEAGIPLTYGVLHQLIGLLYLISLLFLFFSLRKRTN